MKPRYPLIYGMRVDVDALRRLAHRCEPSRCEYETSCCRTYEVFVDREEEPRLIGYMDDAAAYAKGLREADGFIDPLEETEGGSCLATDEDGLCVFAFENRQGHGLCSLHAAALDRGLNPYEVKPFACAIWPLCYVESTPPLLTVQEGVADFPCNSLRNRSRRMLDSGVSQILLAVWGPEFLEAVETAVAGS